MADEKRPDWERIELDYRAGIKSLREMAAEHAITEGAIRKRAKRDSWERDLSAKIQAKADSLVRKELVRAEVRNRVPTHENEIIEVNAQLLANTILSHRQDITRSRALVVKLLEEIEVQTDNQEAFAELAEVIIWKGGEDVETKSDQRRMERMQELFDRIMSNPGRVGSLRNLVQAMETLQNLERRALGMDKEKDQAGGDIADRIHQARKRIGA